ncbi:MAG TPA: caspase family protein, partial [Candidatus Angelobacter sp.]|nr:caspase family protein [Candidatus Angelobacter sp.]
MLVAVLFLCTYAHAQDRCGAGTDLMVQALERVQPASSPAQLRDAVELLKHATNECISLGDAWYYRSLLERKLGNIKLADYSLDKARQNNSDALQQHINPFELSTNREIKPAGPVREKWALVVGIGKFRDPGIPTLHYTAADAASFAQTLTNTNIGRFKSSNVAVLTDLQATTRNIREKLNWLARSAQPDDLVVIYIATHGSSRDFDTAGVNYIITADTEISPKSSSDRDQTSDTDKYVDHDALFATALPMVDVANTVASRVRATRVAVFLDTCFSGAAAGSGGTKAVSAAMNFKPVSSATLDRMSAGAGRAILAASQADQESLESSALGHGFFTYFVLQGLQQS